MRIVFLLFIVTLLGCNKDPELKPTLSDCPTYSELISTLDPPPPFSNDNDFFINVPSWVTLGMFHPLHADEAILNLNPSLTANNSNVIYYNFSTGAYSTIMENPDFFTFPKISSTNWLIFTRPDFQLWKIKSNGDSLTQLTEVGVNFESTWSPDGERIIYKRNYPSGTYKTVIADKNGNFLFTMDLSYKIRIPTWSPDGKFIACGNFNANYENIDIINTETWAVTKLIDFIGKSDSYEYVTDIVFYPDSKHILWTTYTELRKTNIETCVTEVVASTCDSQPFKLASISADGQSILAKKTVYSYYDSTHLGISGKLLLLDGYGREIKEVTF